MTPAAAARGLVGLLAAAAALAYPLLVYVGLMRWSSRLVALLVIAMALLSGARHLLARKAELLGVIAVPAAVISLAVLTAASGSRLFLLLAPVLVSIALLITFGVTLRSGATPMIERFARLQEPDLGPEKVSWCRTTTLVWCAFFVVNGSAAAALAAWAPLSWWAAYTGLVAYLLMGILFVGELVLRKLRFPVRGPAT
jgi:uncharacterized membrane protein